MFFERRKKHFQKKKEKWWQLEKFSPKKCPSSRVHVRVDKALGSFFLFGLKRRKGERGGGRRRDTCGTVKVIRISCISTSNHPPLLLPTFLSSRPGKNGRRMKEEYRGDFYLKEEVWRTFWNGRRRRFSLLFLSFRPLFLPFHPASIPPVWIP